MNEEHEWTGRTCDLYHDTYFEQEGGLKVLLRPIGGGLGHSTALFICNMSESKVQIRLEWHNMPARRKRRVYDLGVGQRKRFVIPPQRRVSILWR